MQIIRISIIILLFLNLNLVFGQNGFIRGSVFDVKTGEFLPGVTVFAEGTTLGTVTDLDGKFSLSIAPGIYQLRISYISYQTINLSNIKVLAGEINLLDDIGLEEVSFELGEAVVTASYIKNTETAMLALKQKSVNLIDGISYSGLKKIGDSDVASSIKRVTGVSVEGGKYVYVRGLGDRYTKTIMNGLDIPGLDPDRNTIQMDIFPTNIIDNLVVYKTFTADLPADFTGGIVDINIKDFPDSKNANISMSAAYNPNSHFNNNYLTYDGGKTDFLGFDDGTRSIPATDNIPFFTDAITDPNGADGIRYRSILESFNPTMGAYKQQSFMDYSIGASLGNQFEAGKYTLGYVLSLSYKNNTDFYEDAVFSKYALSSDKAVTEMERREYQIGDYGVNNVLISGLAGFAIKSKNAKLRLNLMHLQNGESKAGIFDYDKDNLGTTFAGIQHNLEYTQRSLTNILIDGKYTSPGSNWDIVWKFSPTLSTIEDPDIRFTRYKFENNQYSIGTEVGYPIRSWRELNEINLASALHITKSLKLNDQAVKLKFGGAYTYKNRDYNLRNFAINIRDVELTGNPNEIFDEANLWPYNGDIYQGTTYEAGFIPNNRNKYESDIVNAGGYFSVEFNPFTNLKTIVGLRAEKYQQHYTGQNQTGDKVLDNERVMDDLDFFPSLNLIYNLSEEQNLRFSYAKTIARPSFKELSFSQIFDPISGRTFIGGLSRDENLFTNTVYWDGDLKSTDIHNFDLRWELFLTSGQTVSLSVFYKKFNNPIELIQYVRSPNAYQPRNVGDGQVYGVEVELRQNLGQLNESLKAFEFTFNFTYTESRVELSNTEYLARVGAARDGEEIGNYRDMAGQAPFIINAGLAYNGSEKGFSKNIEAGIYYNVQGETLDLVGIADRPDVYTSPFHSLNFNSSKKFGKNESLQLGINIGNILNQDKASVYKSYNATDKFFESRSPGTTFKLNFNYSF
ncbi:MAG: TonB-dependent receptor [Bacteroidales bacterium]|nr:TonB-dependent receptor [Bacteroidales bacterium]